MIRNVLHKTVTNRKLLISSRFRTYLLCPFSEGGNYHLLSIESFKRIGYEFEFIHEHSNKSLLKSRPQNLVMLRNSERLSSKDDKNSIKLSFGTKKPRYIELN